MSNTNGKIARSYTCPAFFHELVTNKFSRKIDKGTLYNGVT